MFFCLTIFLLFFFRIWEDEVNVTTRCSDPEMEPLYDEAGAFRGGHIGEQQRRWAEGEGLFLFYVLLLKTIFFFLILTALSFLLSAQWNEWHSPWKPGLCKGWCDAATLTWNRFFFSWFVAFFLWLKILYLCRAEEHFLVIFLCWRSSRIWTGTQRSLL